MKPLFSRNNINAVYAPSVVLSTVRELDEDSQGFSESRSSNKSSSRKSPTSEKDSGISGHRTASLTTLLSSSPTTSMKINNNNMQSGRLETLEAKMATIESSLSTSSRCRSSTGLLSTASEIDDNATCWPPYAAVWQSLPKGMREVVQEMEVLRRSLREKDVLILRLRRHLAQLCNEHVSQGKDGASELNIEDKKRLEDRLKTLRRDVDCRQIGLKKLRTLLERLKGSENIDVRIQQAELEYQLEKEELNILNVELEAKNIERRLDSSTINNINNNNNSNNSKNNNDSSTGEENPSTTDPISGRTKIIIGSGPNAPAGNSVLEPGKPALASLFASISTGPSNNSKDTQQHQCLALLRVTLTMDPENPRFELTDSGEENTNAGVVVEHAEASTRLEKGDRILEMNGKNVLEDCAEEIRSDILSKLKPGDQVELVVSRELTLGHIFEAKRLREELSVVVDTLQGKLKENQDLSSVITKHQKEKEAMKTDSQRMAHRISYLEDQVAELERSIKNHSRESPSSSSSCNTMTTVTAKPVQVYQRGSNVVTVTSPPSWEKTGKSKHKEKVKESLQTPATPALPAAAPPPPPPPVKEKPGHIQSRLDFFRSIGPKSGGYYVSSAASEVSFSDSEHARPHFQVKNKPAPPKKPDRLHLYRATSVQSVDAAVDNGATRKRKHHNRPSLPADQQHLMLQQQQQQVAEGGISKDIKPEHNQHHHHQGSTHKWPSLQGFRFRHNVELAHFPEPTQRARVQWC